MLDWRLGLGYMVDGEKAKKCLMAKILNNSFDWFNVSFLEPSSQTKTDVSELLPHWRYCKHLSLCGTEGRVNRFREHHSG